MRTTSIRRNYRKNLGMYPIPGTNNSPNNEVDFIGTNNRGWVLEGTLPTRSGNNIPDGYGTLASVEMSMSGLSILEVTGSPIWFYDEIMTINATMNNGTLLTTTSGAWVEVANVDVTRDNTYVDETHEVGYIVGYRLTLTETKV